jgi:hypothetical protein
VKRLGIAIGLLWAVLACTPQPAKPRDVSGSGREQYFTDGMTEMRPSGFGRPTVTLLAGQGSNFQEHVADVDSEGSFVVTQVPGGPYYLKVATDFVVSSEAVLDVSRNFLGRSRAVRAEAASRVVYALSNLQPWVTDSDALHMLSAGGGSSDKNFTARGSTTGTPSDGDTSVNVGTNFSEATSPILPDATLGDRTAVWQLHTKQVPGQDELFYVGATGVFRTSVTLQPQSSVTITGSLSPLSQESHTFTWGLGAFNGLAREVAASTLRPLSSITVNAAPQGGEHGPFNFVPSCFDLNGVLTDGPATGIIAASFGNPYPSTFVQVGEVDGFYPVNYSADGGTPSIFFGVIFYRDLLSRFEDGTLAPKLSPPRAVKVDGSDGFVARTAPITTLTPTLTWDAPSLGTARYYLVSVMRAFNENGSTAFDQVSTLTVKDRKLVIPPGVLERGNSYFFRVRAFDTPSDATKAPFLFSLPQSSAEAMTVLYTLK